MATAIAKTATILGVNAQMIEVEADVHMGLGAFNIVGLPDGAIKESKDRIQSALKNACGGVPIRRVIINLAPADIKKTGTGFDLPIALAILEAYEKLPEKSLHSHFIIGELSLEGKIRPVPGILAIAMTAQKNGIEKLIVAHENAAQASLVEGLEIYSAAHISEVFAHFATNEPLSRCKSGTYKELTDNISTDFDFADVKGQETAKRSLEIAAAGKHNVLFSGPPGSGKSMLAKRLPSILPFPTFEENLEATKIHSIAGTLSNSYPLLPERPFRSPHYSVSGAGLIGGGTTPKPGEVSLAHHGVLFLDELPEFPRHMLDLLRQPLEDKNVTIARANMSLNFPSDFILLAAMNPCACGYLGDSNKECTCSATAIIRYRSRISGPLMDRIDLQVEMPNLSYDELNFSAKGENSAVIRDRVMVAREIQLARFHTSTISYNANMSHHQVELYCGLSHEGHDLLAEALKKYRLSGRAHDSILKMARTIADLEQSVIIEPWHLAEAINYRCLDKELNY